MKHPDRLKKNGHRQVLPPSCKEMYDKYLAKKISYAAFTTWMYDNQQGQFLNEYPPKPTTGHSTAQREARQKELKAQRDYIPPSLIPPTGSESEPDERSSHLH